MCYARNGWKFVAEIDHEGILMPRVIYVDDADRENALRALKAEFLNATVMGQAERATSDELDVSGGRFREGERIRLVQI